MAAIGSWAGATGHRFAASALIVLAVLRSISANASSDQAQTSPLSAVVGIEATAPADAHSAATLGTKRNGSGVVIDAAGLVLTAGYLIIDTDNVVLTLVDGRKVPATPIAYDSDSGFGLLRASAPLGVKPVDLGDSNVVAQNDQVLIASADGDSAAVPAIVVARHTFIGYWEYMLENAIFTAPIYPAFGGAALFAADGRLVGIGSLAMLDVTEGSRPMPGNMFIPIDRLKRILGDLLERGRTARSRPWIGVNTQELAGGRLLVTEVSESGPCARAGIRPGDIVIGFDGEPLSGLEEFYRKLWSKGDAGVSVTLDVLQGLTINQVEVTSMDRYRLIKLSRDY